MGSWFSSPAAGDRRRPVSHRPRIRLLTSMLALARSDQAQVSDQVQEHDGRLHTEEEWYAGCICWLAHGVLKHYNANNPGAEYSAESATEMKAACTGFGEGFIWYHLSFSARRRDSQEMHLFFAELSYELCHDTDCQKINLVTCTILEKPFRTSCAFCPEESKIMHPREEEFVCGKEGQKAEFFDMTDMLTWPYENTTCDLDL